MREIPDKMLLLREALQCLAEAYQVTVTTSCTNNELAKNCTAKVPPSCYTLTRLLWRSQLSFP